MLDIVREYTWQEFLFSTDKKKLDLNYVHSFLTQSYWAKGIPLQLVESSVRNSLSIGIYTNDRQMGFARVITDYTTFAYLADVFIDESFRGKGLSKILMTFILSFEEFRFLRRFILATRDAHGLYSQFGFNPLKNPDRFMERPQPDVYKTFL
jgi:N-acetylglutamate synthase-like GNAT family acetyltransferase